MPTEPSPDVRELDITPDPDFSRLEAVLRREGTPDRVPFYELHSNITEDVLRRIGKWEEADEEQLSDADRNRLHDRRGETYMLSLGYDYVNVGGRGFGFPQPQRAVGDTKQGKRGYLKGDAHVIATREEFEAHPWVDMATVDYSPLEGKQETIPKGMRGIAGSAGILENTMWMLGYEGIGLLLYDDPELVRDMFDAVGARIVEYLGTCASYDVVGAVQMGEDMGFKTQTMLSPDVYREYLFPWHRRLVEAVHAHGKPIILHACGNLNEIMEDIIDCGWDAKHSFEDGITPVWEAKERWGDRIALLGGFDMHKISTMNEQQVREHTRLLIDRCAPGGGWAPRTGTSVANSVPVDNLLTMLGEERRYD